MLLEPETWVAIAFVILMGAFAWLGVHRTVLTALDHRAERIKAELDDARRLKEEAAKVLHSGGDTNLLLVTGGALTEQGLALAQQIAGKSAFTVATGKAAFYRQAELDLAAAYAYASEVMTRNMLAADAAEGIDAFIEKRAPVWRDA